MTVFIVCYKRVESPHSQLYTLSFYDYEDDSGIRNFSGLRPGCGDSGGKAKRLRSFSVAASQRHTKPYSPIQKICTMVPIGYTAERGMIIFLASSAMIKCGVTTTRLGLRRQMEMM